MTLDLNKPMMDEPSVAPRRSSRWRAIAVILVLAILIVVVSSVIYLNSDSFREVVRQRVVAELTRITGGRIDLKSFSWSLTRSTIEIDDVTIHGREDAKDVPFLHVDHITARVKVVSLFTREVDLKSIVVRHPIAHIIVYPDGTTNQPTPAVASTGSDSVKQLLDLAIDHFEIDNGELIFNERHIPLNMRIDDFESQMNYSSHEKRYDAHIKASRVESKVENWKPFTGAFESNFTLGQNLIQVKSLSAVARDTHLAAAGTISNFANPTVDLHYTIAIDVAQVAAITGVQQLRAGVLQLDGLGTYNSLGFSSNGKAILKNLELADPQLRMKNIDGGATYAVTPKRIVIPHIFLHGARGTANGKITVDNWLTPSVAPSGKNGIVTSQVGTADFTVTDASLSELARDVSSRLLPLDKLRPAGVISGKLVASWKGSPHFTNVDVDLVSAASNESLANAMPVSGAIHGNYSLATSDLRIDHLSLSSPATHVEASGDLGTSRSSLKLTASTSNLHELMPIIDAIRGDVVLPFQLSGTATFNGTIGGVLRTPSIAGNLQATNFTSNLPSHRPASSVGPVEEHIVRWDSLNTDFNYSPSQLSVIKAILRRGRASVVLDGSAHLEKGLFTDDSVFQLRARIEGEDLAQLQTALGYDYPVSGRVDLNMQVNGTRSDLHGGGSLSITNATAYSRPITSLTSNIVFANQEAQFQKLIVKSPLGDVTGSGGFNLSTENFYLDFHGRNFRLENSSFANQSKFRSSGLVTFDAQGSGTPQAPVINANIFLSNLVVNGRSLGDLKIDAITQGADLRLTSHSTIRDSIVILDGRVHLRDEMPGQAVLTLSSKNLNPLLAAFVPIRLTNATTLDSRIQVKGPFRNPKDLAVNVQIDQLTTELEGIEVHNAGPITFHVADRVLTVDRLRFAGEGNRFLQVQGTAELSNSQRINMHADGDVNLKLLQSIHPNLVSGGNADFDVAVAGTLRRPLMNGQVHLHNGALALIDLPNGLSDVNGTLYFNQDRLQIQSLTARTGGGLLNLGGFVTYQHGPAFNITATGRDIRIRYPQGVSSTANADLTLTGNLNSSVLAGDISIVRFGLNQDFDFATYLARGKEPLGTNNFQTPLNNVRLDLHVLSRSELQVQTTLAKIIGNVDLHVRGTGARPSVLGHINIIEGQVDFSGTTYTLERGDIRFLNPVTIDPILDIEASAHVRDYDITIGFHGSPLQNKLATSYRSDPPLPPGDIIALLALGRTREEAANPSTAPASQQQTYSDSTSSALLGEAINATVSNRVQKIFGVSRVKIDPQISGTETSGHARLTVDQQISNKITLTYITDLAASAQQIIQFEYNINRNVSILAVRDQNGIISFDVRLRQRKR